MPYIILGSFGYMAYASIRRAKAGQDAGGDRTVLAETATGPPQS
jgi:hypothetical protein